MIKISEIKLMLEQVVDSKNPLILLHAKPWLAYANGKVTDERLGTQYEVIENGGNFQRFWVKVADAPDIAISEEEIKQSDGKIVVEFENAICTLYTDSAKNIQISVKASAIIVK